MIKNNQVKLPLQTFHIVPTTHHFSLEGGYSKLNNIYIILENRIHNQLQTT